MPAIVSIRHLSGGGLLVAAALLSGCATTTAPSVAPTSEEFSSVPEPGQPEYLPVVRSGRYTLVELAPTAAQRDLLLQIVDVSMPEDAHASVGDGLHHVLKRSGYQLCESDSVTTALYALPLPLAHLQLGPMTLRDALVMLAGSAWDLQIDDVARQICFVRSNSSEIKLEPASDIPASEPVVTFPVTVTGVRS
ncbi:PilL N-terminal domain-containing protein [Pollutimonas sp. H1-120]|uniref:PFGI-1 class ICE element type IV pilus protein PilL2 n=1 Tax=Pollutimonas sp. H1-120 TaxID=3148824 RepID=UPI003B52FB08